MRVATGLCAAVLLAGIGWTATGQAQGLPQGSYAGSCNDVRIEGDRLTATCRAKDGRQVRNALAGFRRCVGDIGNNNGVLQCGVPGGAQLRGELVGGGFAGPQGGPPPRGAPPPPPPYGAPGPGAGPGYGGPGYGGPGYGGPGYGGPGNGGPDWRERCEHLRGEAHELRDRLANEYNPYEHGRIEARLREVEEQRERCR